ncbi:MAG: hypothetical protein AAF636_11565 [Pseudomonadota bacterium]
MNELVNRVENPVLDVARKMLKNERGTLLARLTGFCLSHENGKVFGNWKPFTVKQMIAYHAAKNTLYYGLDAQGEVEAVLMWYRCNLEDTWEFIQDWHPDRADGDSIFMAFLFAAHTAAFKRLTLSFIGMEPDVLTKRLIGVRYRNNQPCRVTYTPKIFAKILKLKEGSNHGR